VNNEKMSSIDAQSNCLVEQSDAGVASWHVTSIVHILFQHDVFILPTNVFDLVMGQSLVMGHFLHSVSHQ